MLNIARYDHPLFLNSKPKFQNNTFTVVSILQYVAMNILKNSTLVQYCRDIEGVGYNITLKPATSFPHNSMTILVR